MLISVKDACRIQAMCLTNNVDVKNFARNLINVSVSTFKEHTAWLHSIH